MNGFRLKAAFVALLLSVSCLAAEGYSFQVVRQGTGQQTVVFIPGFACSGEVWHETVEAIGNSCTCYVLTMPGFAGVAPEAHPSFEGWKQQIIRFIEEEHLERPVLVGHSMGGGLALAVAAERPDLLKSVVVVDALPCLSALYNPAAADGARRCAICPSATPERGQPDHGLPVVRTAGAMGHDFRQADVCTDVL